MRSLIACRLSEFGFKHSNSVLRFLDLLSATQFLRFLDLLMSGLTALCRSLKSREDFLMSLLLEELQTWLELGKTTPCPTHYGHVDRWIWSDDPTEFLTPDIRDMKKFRRAMREMQINNLWLKIGRFHKCKLSIPDMLAMEASD